MEGPTLGGAVSIEILAASAEAGHWGNLKRQRQPFSFPGFGLPRFSLKEEKYEKELGLTTGNIPRALTAFILPMILGSLIQQLYTTADAVIVEQFAGKAGLAAIDSVHTLFQFPINFMNGLVAGATILISGCYGARDEGGLRCCVRTAGTLALVLGASCAASF